MPFTGYRITSPYGWRIHPIKKVRAFHTGIDMVKSHRAPIHAFTAGKVLFAGMGKAGTGLGGYGNVVLIEDKNNRGQLYAHLDSVAVKKGQTVSKGQVIGYQGDTGLTIGSHLHYEVRKKAESDVPYGWIPDRANNCLEPTAYLRRFDHDDNSPSSTNAISMIQRTLNSRYGFNIKVDGLYGPETKAALVKAFQTELNRQFNRGLVVDGKFGPKMRSAVVNVRLGSRGNITWIMQALLLVHGFNPGPIDGIHGAKTQAAIKAFQRAKKIAVDGIAGRVTWTMLFR